MELQIFFPNKLINQNFPSLQRHRDEQSNFLCVSQQRPDHSMKVVTIDLSNPDAAEWFKNEVIIKNTIEFGFKKSLSKTFFIKRSCSLNFCQGNQIMRHSQQINLRIFVFFTQLKAMSQGWMADFGEYLPYSEDVLFYDGTDGTEWHNKFSEKWANLNMQVRY